MPRDARGCLLTSLRGGTNGPCQSGSGESLLLLVQACYLLHRRTGARQLPFRLSQEGGGRKQGRPAFVADLNCYVVIWVDPTGGYGSYDPKMTRCGTSRAQTHFKTKNTEINSRKRGRTRSEPITSCSGLLFTPLTYLMRILLHFLCGWTESALRLREKP